MRKFKVHTFDSTEEAYNASQCDDRVRTGDILVTKETIGVADTWPVAVTVSHGELHTPNETVSLAGLVQSMNEHKTEDNTVDFRRAFGLAVKIAKDNGMVIHPLFKGV